MNESNDKRRARDHSYNSSSDYHSSRGKYHDREHDDSYTQRISKDRDYYSRKSRKRNDSVEEHRDRDNDYDPSPKRKRKSYHYYKKDYYEDDVDKRRHRDSERANRDSDRRSSRNSERRSGNSDKRYHNDSGKEEDGASSRKKSSRRSSRSRSRSAVIHVKPERVNLNEFGYSDDANPFGDGKLSNMFVWKRKYESKVSDPEDLKKVIKTDLREKKKVIAQDVEKVKLRRELRAKDKEEIEQLRAQMETEAQKEEMEHLDNKEEDFHKDQAKVRSKIRLKENRANAFDLLFKNPLLWEKFANDKQSKQHHFLDVDVLVQTDPVEPSLIIEALNEEELKQLKQDIEEHLKLKMDTEYWSSAWDVCRHQISLLSVQSQTATLHFVEDEIKNLLKDMSSISLQDLRKLTMKQLQGEGTTTVVDVDFWDTVSEELHIYISKAYLREFYKKVCKMQEYEGSSPKLEESELHPLVKRALSEKSTKPVSQIVTEPSANKQETSAPRSPVHRPTEPSSVKSNRYMTEEQMYTREAAKAMAEDEERFTEEVELPEGPDAYWWRKQYKPRKPKYFNRVQTGYDWNKYNQVHYDKDNPPPKVVQGYKFNIFYPELVDPAVAPKFVFENDPLYPNGEFCILRFKAGAPYEDIAFRVFNQEWETSHRKGYLCKFENGLLQLHFEFKKFRYKR